MIRELTIIFALGTSGLVFDAVLGSTLLGGMDAYAQTTDQTDKSEEDWRKSKKKHDTSDIFKDILNKNSIGQGTNQYPQNPIDILPKESRRHLMKERAKVIARSDHGKTPDTPYTPSEAAKTDPELAEQEKEAWTVIMTDMKGDNTQGSGGTGQNKVAISGQGGGQAGQNGQGNSPLRGGSSQSVADILAQIKGMRSSSVKGSLGSIGSVPTQQEPRDGQGTLGQASKNQASEKQTHSQAQAHPQSSKGQSTTAGQYQNSSQDTGQNQNPQNNSDASFSINIPPSNNGQDATQADIAQEVTIAKTAPDPIGPLDRIKQDQVANTSGTHTSTAYYFQKYKDED